MSSIDLENKRIGQQLKAQLLNETIMERATLKVVGGYFLGLICIGAISYKNERWPFKNQFMRRFANLMERNDSRLENILSPIAIPMGVIGGFSIHSIWLKGQYICMDYRDRNN